MVVMSLVIASTSRTRSPVASAINVLPLPSIQTPCGPVSLALAAGPPSPSALPPPATVLILPPETSLIRPLPKSAIRKFVPAGLTQTSSGLFSFASVAEPPSPEKPGVPVPAIVVIVPVA